MSSRRGRLNWSNLEIHISDRTIENQHRFNASSGAIIEEKTQDEVSTKPKRGWMPKKEAEEMNLDHFVGNYMLTNMEQAAMEEKYTKVNKTVERPESSPFPKNLRFSNRLTPSEPLMKLPDRTQHLYIGQHLVNVFVCHVESYSHVYIMFGDEYNRATKLFEDMNICVELIRDRNNYQYKPKEKDFVAINHEKKWFRGQCLDQISSEELNVKCIDSGAIIACSSKGLLCTMTNDEQDLIDTRFLLDLRRLPDRFRTVPPCCIECTLLDLPTTIEMDTIPETIHSQCYDLLYKDRYEAIVTQFDLNNRPMIVLYYADLNVNDQLRAILKLL